MSHSVRLAVPEEMNGSSLRENETLPNPCSAATEFAYPLKRILWQRGWALGLTYGLLNVENLLKLLQPWALATAVTDLLRESTTGLYLFVGVHMVHTLLATCRRLYDTRLFMALQTRLASELVRHQRAAGQSTSVVAARARLSRHAIDFFERDLPITFTTFYNLVGSWLMLLLFEWRFGLISLVCCLPVGALIWRHAQRGGRLAARINNRLEREVRVIEQARPTALRRHYHLLARWRVCLSDSEAGNLAVIECLMVGLALFVLLRGADYTGQEGDLLAILRYVTMYVMALANLPMLIQQLALLQDSCRRMASLNVNWETNAC